MPAWANYDGNGNRTEPERFLPLLSRVESPVLVVTGVADALSSKAAGAAAASWFACAEHHELDGAGHYPWVDTPAAFVETVRTYFLS